MQPERAGQGRLAPQPPSLDEELRLWSCGLRCVAGLDEAGRGAWAGPVVAAAVVLPADASVIDRLRGVADSKQLSPGQRERLFVVIQAEAAGVGVGIVAAGQIDAIGIAAATRQAMGEALAALRVAPDYLLIDYVRLPAVPTGQLALVRGDGRVLSIAAASIVAKVTRDRLLDELEVRYPGYGLGRHKGYGTAAHLAALQRLGPTPEHRMSFRPVCGWQMSLLPAGMPEGAQRP